MRNKVKSLLLLFIAGLFFSACSNEAKDQSIQLPATTEYIEADSLKIPVYNFESIESLLNRKDEHVYLINFWATWCKPCVKELPGIEAINKSFKGQGVNVVLVSLDFKSAAKTSLIPFIREKNISSQVVLLSDPDADAWISRVDASWSGAIPATLIYNAEKRLFHEGELDQATIEKMLMDFL